MGENTNPAKIPMGELEEVFKKFDSDGDGKISVTDLMAILNSLGTKTTVEETNGIMSLLDVNGDGSIDLEEFKELQLGSGDEKELKEAFDLFDKDKNGKISAVELYSTFQSLGEKRLMKDCQKMIANVDVDGDGYVDFEEFKKMMASPSAKES